MEDLVNFAKANVEKLEKRILDSKVEIDKGRTDKKKEEENIKAL